MAAPTVAATRRHSPTAGAFDLRRLSRPQLSWLTLSASAFVVALVLLVWLLLWISRPRGGVAGWWVAQRGLATPVIGHQPDDLHALLKRAQRDAGYQSLEASLRDRFAGGGGRTVVVYLSAAGVSDAQGAYFLRPESGSLHIYGAAGSRPSLLDVDKLVDLCAEHPATKKLLILDAGQVGSDRNLGVYGNGFVEALRSRLDARKPRGVAVLCSCAAAQTSWTSEADRRSVFAYYVAQGLSGKAAGWDGAARGLTVRALHRYVAHHVGRWVAANRQAEQTPVLLGDPAVNFALRPPTPARAEPPTPDEKAVSELWTKVDAGWARRDALARRTPYRNTPLLWQQYQETLLRAERLLRNGELAEADDVLGTLPSLEKKLSDAASAPPWESFWSLALLEKNLSGPASEGRKADFKASVDNLEAAYKELTGGTEESAEPAHAEPKEVVPVADEPGPAAEAEKAQGAAPRKAEKPRPRNVPAPTRPRGASALSTIMARDDQRPLYVEGQLLAWVGAFSRQSGAPYAFKGARGDLLFEALQVRRLAEEAAASDERLTRWVAPLVDEGDRLRRRAQDGLFAGDTGQFEALGGLLDQARARYREALDVADGCGKALDLVQKLDAELPYYGEWEARRGARRGEGLDQEFVDLLGATAALARLVQSDPSGAHDRDEGLDAFRDQVRKLEDQSRLVSAAAGRLQAEFQAQCSGLAAAGAGRWRELDALLAVPLVPAETRRALLQRVRSVTAAGTLAGSESTAPPAVASPDAPPTAPDPDFWKQALALARLEWGLLEIGGASEGEIGRLEDAYETAKRATNGEPSAALAAFARLSDLVRVVRAGRLQSFQQPRAPAFPALAAADQAARVLPLADSLGLADKAAADLDQFHRQALLVWHGRRLLLDYAPGHAQRLFAAARKLLETDALRSAVAEAEAMARARLVLQAEPDETIRIRGWTDEALGVGVTAVGPVPPGDATLFVRYDATQPLNVSERSARRSAREGILLPVRPEKASGRVEYAVSRTESSRELILANLSPGAFYRGRFFQNDRALQVALEPAKDPVALSIQQSYEGLRFKDFTDQFKEHPGQGYLHFGTNLQYKLVLASDRPLKVVVRYGLKEHPESFQTKELEISPKKRGEIIDVVKGNDFPIVKNADALLSIAPLNLEVTVWKDRENGTLQARARYTFRMIPPSQYIACSADYDPSTRIVVLYITHLANDPVTGPVEVFAAVGGSQLPGVIRRSQIAPVFFRVPLAVKKVRWRVGIESLPAAFTDEIDTPPPPAPEAPPQQPPPATE